LPAILACASGVAFGAFTVDETVVQAGRDRAASNGLLTVRACEASVASALIAGLFTDTATRVTLRSLARADLAAIASVTGTGTLRGALITAAVLATVVLVSLALGQDREHGRVEGSHRRRKCDHRIRCADDNR